MKTILALLFLFAAALLARAKQPPEIVGSAIDANGKHYVARDPTGMPPWMADTVYAPKPDYPYEARSHHSEGTVVVRVEIDLKTGNAAYVTLIQSSGFKNLDEAAIRALARWRFKPGRWKQVETPIVFTFTRPNYSGPGHP